jgi:anthranilate/para-aminobenzoate synthase component II
LPMEAVQFHPESILTLGGSCGLKLMENVVRVLGRTRVRAGTP